MTNERAQSDVRINSAEQGGIGRSQIESLFKTHYTQMYHLALTLLFDEAESKDVVSDVFASLLSAAFRCSPSAAEEVCGGRSGPIDIQTIVFFPRYPASGNFCRYFKRVTGIYPQEYKNQLFEVN